MKIFWRMICLIIAMLALTTNVMAFTDEEAIRSIVGEARGEFGVNREKKFYAMIMVAHAIKNRGTLKGVYGLTAKGLEKEPRWIWVMAETAWKQAKNEKNDPTDGATHWENVQDFGKPYWMKSMDVTMAYGKHVFMKEKKNA